MEDNKMNTKQKPEHEIRIGKIRAAIWANASENGAWHTVTVSRLYKNEEGQWRDSTAFGREDLLLLAKVVDKAHTWVCEQRSESIEEDRQTEASKGDGNPLAAYVVGSHR